MITFHIYVLLWIEACAATVLCVIAARLYRFGHHGSLVVWCHDDTVFDLEICLVYLYKHVVGPACILLWAFLWMYVFFFCSLSSLLYQLSSVRLVSHTLSIIYWHRIMISTIITCMIPFSFTHKHNLIETSIISMSIVILAQLTSIEYIMITYLQI